MMRIYGILNPGMAIPSPGEIYTNYENLNSR
jgi:hypothetical protein